MNGKIYIISIIRNIIAEEANFFDEEELSKFLDKIVSQKNSFIIYEFVELTKNLVHSRSMCKRMENVFKYLIREIESPLYSLEFKKKMLDLILCLSYENANIKDYSLQELLTLVKNLDININEKTTLLILMNFSSLSSNFAFLMEDYKEPFHIYEDKKKFNLTKKGFIEMINHLIDSDKFSQILIQRLLINITSIDGIDMSIISYKIMKILLEILIKSQNIEDNMIIFSLATLVNISNRNLLKFEKKEEKIILDEENNDIKNISSKNVSSNNSGDENKEKDKDKEILNIYINKWEGSHSYFIDFPEVTIYIQKQLQKIDQNIRVLYVCGMDHYIKCLYSFSRNVIAVDRKPFQNLNQRFKDKPNQYIFIVRDENSEPYSSTSIRESYHKKDYDNIRKSTFPKVADMIIEFYDNFYKNNNNNNIYEGDKNNYHKNI
jgi:hypothetical protein